MLVAAGAPVPVRVPVPVPVRVPVPVLVPVPVGAGVSVSSSLAVGVLAVGRGAALPPDPLRGWLMQSREARRTFMRWFNKKEKKKKRTHCH